MSISILFLNILLDAKKLFYYLCWSGISIALAHPNSTEKLHRLPYGCISHFWLDPFMYFRDPAVPVSHPAHELHRPPGLQGGVIPRRKITREFRVHTASFRKGYRRDQQFYLCSSDRTADSFCILFSNLLFNNRHILNLIKYLFIQPLVVAYIRFFRLNIYTFNVHKHKVTKWQSEL